MKEVLHGQADRLPRSGSGVLHIGLIMRYGREWIGGTEYIKNIVLSLAGLPEETRSTFKVSLICGASVNPSYYNPVVPHLEQVYPLDLERIFESPDASGRRLGQLRQKVRSLLPRGGESSFDAFLKRTHIDFIYPYSERGSISCRHASWIYDFQHKYLSHLFSKEEIEKRDRVFLRVARGDSTVVFSSRNAASDFFKFFPEATSKPEILSFRVHPERSWYEEDPVKVQKEYSLPDRFFLICNQFWIHKNHQVVFEALKLLRERSAFPVVVCTGSLYDYREPEYSNVILQAIHRLGVAGQVHLLGLIPRKDQIQLLRRSLAVIQPSLFEGWNTVVEEARCFAKPTLLSDIAVHREQNPPGSEFFDPSSPQSLASILATWWEKLSPGPHLEKEAAARVRALDESKAFAYRFLELARSGKGPES
jgi:glycosyltransferase involved in cell wall biosynthesis